MRSVSQALAALAAGAVVASCGGSSSTQVAPSATRPADLIGSTAVPTPSPGETLILIYVDGPLTKEDLDATRRRCDSAPGVTRILAGPQFLVVGTTSGGAAFDQVRACARSLPFVRSVL